jgi:hypothetical protein
MNQEVCNILDLSGNTIINLGNPINGYDAINKDSLYSNFNLNNNNLIKEDSFIINKTGIITLSELCFPKDVYAIDGSCKSIEYFFTINKPANGSNTFRFEFISGSVTLLGATFATGSSANNWNVNSRILQSLREKNAQSFGVVNQINLGTTISQYNILNWSSEDSTWNKELTNNISVRVNITSLSTPITFKVCQIKSFM